MNNLTGSSWSPVLAQAPPTASSATFTYGYNGADQRVSQTATDNSFWSYPAATPVAISYTANNLDQYTAIGSVTPTYDGNGNLTYDGTFTYGYDAESRLISASGAGNSATYAYDAQGRRKSKTLNGTTTLFVQDPQGRALIDYNGSGGAVTNWYAFGQGPNDVLNQVSVSGSTRATYVPDIQGSIVASLDASSGTLTKAGFQPYGESGTTAGTFRYTGARIDAETNGLYDFRARMYSPVLGRFMQTDPIGTAGGINLYAYVMPKTACDRAKVPDFHPHDLRHTAATRLLRSKGNLKLAQRLLRHASITTTAKYAHVFDDELRDALDSMHEVPKNSRKDAANA